MEKLTKLENLIKKNSNLFYTCNGAEYPEEQKQRNLKKLPRSVSGENFKTNFCVQERMFDHFLPAQNFLFFALRESFETFLPLLDAAPSYSLRIQLFCIITLCLFIAL